MRYWPGQSLLKNHAHRNHRRRYPIQGPRHLNGITFILVATLWLSGCQTLPRWESQNPWGLFPSEASLYSTLPIPEHRELLDNLLSCTSGTSGKKGNVSKGLAYFLDHTSEVYLVILDEDTRAPFLTSASPRWILAGVGEYSSFLLRLSLTPDEGWEKRKIRTSGYTLSYYQQQELQVALPDTRLLIVSNGGIEFPLKQFVIPRTDSSWFFSPPIGTKSSLRGSMVEDSRASRPIGLYVPHTGIPLLTPLLDTLFPKQNQNRGSPIEAFHLSMDRINTHSYSATGRIRFQREEQARSMSVLIRIVLAGMFLQQEQKGVPNSVQIQVNGPSIEFAGIPLSMEAIAQFICSMVDTVTRTPPW